MLNEIPAALWTFLGVGVAGLLAVWAKRTPERKSPHDYHADQIKSLLEQVKTQGEQSRAQNEQVASLTTSNAAQWRVLEELRGEISSLNARLGRVVAYAKSLEVRLIEVGHEVDRPRDLETLFKETD